MGCLHVTSRIANATVHQCPSALGLGHVQPLNVSSLPVNTSEHGPGEEEGQMTIGPWLIETKIWRGNTQSRDRRRGALASDLVSAYSEREGEVELSHPLSVFFFLARHSC